MNTYFFTTLSFEGGYVWLPCGTTMYLLSKGNQKPYYRPAQSRVALTLLREGVILKNISLVSLALALTVASCDGDTFNYTGGTTTVEGDTITTSTTETTNVYNEVLTSTPTIGNNEIPAPATTSTASLMTCKYEVELRGYENLFRQTQFERGSYVYQDAAIEIVCEKNGQRLYLEEVSIIAGNNGDGTIPVVNPILQVQGQQILSNTQFDETTRVATWQTGRYELDQQNKVSLHMYTEIRRDATFGYHSIAIRSLIIRDENGRVVRANVESFNTIYAQFEVVETLQQGQQCSGAGCCRESWGTRWNSTAQACEPVPSQNPPVQPSTPNCPSTEIKMFALPTNNGDATTRRNDWFSVPYHLDGCLPSGATVSMAIRFDGNTTLADFNGSPQVYVNGQYVGAWAPQQLADGTVYVSIYFTLPQAVNDFEIRMDVYSSGTPQLGAHSMELLQASFETSDGFAPAAIFSGHTTSGIYFEL